MDFWVCCGLLVLLGTVALVGKALWELAAAVFKALSGRTDPPPPPPRRRHWCPGCEHELLPTDLRCPTCGLEQGSRLATRLEHTRFAVREVAGLVERGELDAATAEPVTAALRARVQSLIGPAPAPAEPVLARPLDTVPPLQPEPVPAPVAAVPVAPPEEPPRRGGSLAGFMEERNIFWGELVGGLLIVGCSIALVLSLWRTLEQLPYAPFLLAASVTAALFGAGQYTLHHWRLASTSRGLLVISLLLAPLNLLLLATPAADGGVLDIGVKVAALIAFVAMARGAGRDLIGTDLLPGPIDRRWLLALAVVGAPAVVWVPAGTASPWLPLACHVAACGAVLAGLTWYRRDRNSDPLSEGAAGAVLVFVGVSLFALGAAWGLLLTRAADVPFAVRGLAVPLVIAAVPLLEAGLLVQRRIVAGHAGLKATATGTAVAGAALLATGVLLAWPDPLRLTLAAAAAGALLTRVAWREGQPTFQFAAVPLLALAFVLAGVGAAGDWAGGASAEWTRTLLASAAAGVGYVGFALVLAAVGNYAAATGRRALGESYALGGLVVAAAGLLVVTGHGDQAPWPAAGAFFAAAVGLLVANVSWKARTVAQLGMWLVLMASLWALSAINPPGGWGVAVAVEALVLAATALALTPFAARPGPRGVVFGQLRIGCRDVATGAAVLAVVFTIDPRVNRLHAATLLTLFPTGLLLARVAARPAFTWAGSAALLVGLAHLAYYTLEVRPTRAALLPAALAHAWAVVLLALAFRGKRSRERLFTNPLRATARVSACVAGALLFVPPAGFAPEWAGYAAGLAALGFVAAWVWREPGSFSPAQAALAAAAVLGGLVCVERQDWWADADLRDPRALRAFGVALALLGLVWVAARRLAARSERLRALWLADPFALDRIVIGAVIVGQFLCLAAAVEPGVRDELTPLGWSIPPAPAHLAHAFEPMAWLLPGLLAVVLLGWLRLRTDAEPNGDPALVGLVLLLLTVPVLIAGSVAPQLAAASAVRWGMGVAFVIGSALVFARRPLAELAERLGFRPAATSAARLWSYVLLGGAAAVVVMLTADVARLGLNRLTPSGPGADTVFARIGWTWSNVVPMALVVLGLAGTAARERLPGYAFVAGLTFTATVTGGYALGVVTAGGAFGPVENLRFVMLAVGSVVAWAALWIAAERRVPGGPLLDLQAAAGLFGVGLVALAAAVRLLVFPDRGLEPAFAEFGLFGWPLLAVAAWTCLNRAAPHAPQLRAEVVGFAGMVAGVVAACAVVPLDEPGSRLSFETLAVGWAVVGLLHTSALFRAPLLSRGSWLVVVAVGLVVAAFVGPGPKLRHWGSPVGLAGYSALVAALAAWLAAPAVRVGYRWRRLIAAEVVVAAAAGLLAAALAVAPFPLADRLGGPVAVLLLAVAAELLARKAPLAAHLRCAAVLLAAGALALTGWAAPNPTEPAVWLKRNGWAFVALVAAATACRAAPVAALRRPGGLLAAVSLAALAVVLVQECLTFDPDPEVRRTPLDLTETLAILASIGALAGLALATALRPGADLLGLPERRRTAYVYLAELLLVLFFAHVRLNLPELFVGNIVRYWTFIVMLLAFLGVGAAEVAERRRLTVLSGPLRRTGVLLPLVPLLAFWVKPPGFVLAFADGNAPGLRPFLGYLERLPQHFDSYAGLWFLGGLLYGLIALQRRSFGWAVLAALAANAGVWSLLAHNGVSATVHPQVWVIPLALIVLIAEHVNRRELKPELATGLRYAGVGLLYVSSAADMFIAGVGESLWLPVVLAVFCVAGILGGILLRVRAFLFLGAAFLLLDVFAMIWHAAVDRAQTWVWYASGIVLGAAILALFAVFEKKKNEVREVVEELRKWD